MNWLRDVVLKLIVTILVCIGFSVVFVLLLYLHDLTTPTDVYLLGVSILCLGLLISEEAWVKALRKAMVPVWIGLVMLWVVQLVLNLVAPAPAPATEEAALVEAVGTAEFFIYRLYKAMHAVSSLPWVLAVALLLGLLLVSVYWSRGQLVSRYVSLSGYLAKAAATLGFVTSFTFFADRGLLKPRADQAYKHIKLRYLGERTQLKALLTEILQREVVSAMLQQVRQHPTQAATFRATLTVEQELKLPPATIASLLAYRLSAPQREEPYKPNELTQAQEAVLRQQPEQKLAATQRELVQAARAIDEAKAGEQKILEETFSEASKPLREGFKALAEAIATHWNPLVGTAVAEIVNKLSDSYVEASMKPRVEKIMQETRPWLQRWAQQFPPLQAGPVIRAAVQDLLVTQPRQHTQEALACLREAIELTDKLDKSEFGLAQKEKIKQVSGLLAQAMQAKNEAEQALWKFQPSSPMYSRLALPALPLRGSPTEALSQAEVLAGQSSTPQQAIAQFEQVFATIGSVKAEVNRTLVNHIETYGWSNPEPRKPWEESHTKDIEVKPHPHLIIP